MWHQLRGSGPPAAEHWIGGHLGRSLCALAAAPLVAITSLVVAMVLSHCPIVGPEPGSLLFRIGASISYSVPLVVCALLLVGHAMHQRSAGLALAAGLMVDLCATAAYLLAPGGSGLPDVVQWMRVAQLTAVCAGVYGLLWWAAVRKAAGQWLGRFSRVVHLLFNSYWRSGLSWCW